jgi:O-methyltransferase
MKDLIHEQLRRRGYKLVRTPVPDAITRAHPDFEPEFAALYPKCAAPRSATSAEWMYATWQAVRYACARGIPGDLVECGVYRGGNAMLMAMTLGEAGHANRRVYLYDTFDGMTEPGEHDIGEDGRPLSENWEVRSSNDDSLRVYASLDEVKGNMALTGFDEMRIA